jgi:hypothetical protein
VIVVDRNGLELSEVLSNENQPNRRSVRLLTGREVIAQLHQDDRSMTGRPTNASATPLHGRSGNGWRSLEEADFSDHALTPNRFFQMIQSRDPIHREFLRWKCADF